MKPISNGIVTLHDENDNDKGAFNCMQLIKFLTAEGCTEWALWHKAHLRLMQQQGLIADFVYTDNASGQTVVEDTKGVRTKEYIIKRKLMLHVHNIHIHEI